LVELSLVNLSVYDKVKIDDSTKSSVIAYCVDLLIAFSKMYKDMPSFREVFSLTKTLLEALQNENTPNEVEVIYSSEF
jgi:hypothetical protein